MIREALIPAAGPGMRLDRPNTPKPLVEVDGQAMVVRLIRQLAAAGVEKIVVVVGFEGERITRTLAKYDFDAEVVCVENSMWEQGIATSILAGAEHISNRFLLAMADHVFDDALISQAAKRCIPDNSVCALIETDLDKVFDKETAVKVAIENERILAMGRALRDFNGVDAGLFSLPVCIFDEIALQIAPHEENELATMLVPLIRRRRLTADVIKQGTFDDIDTPAALVHAEMRLRKSRRHEKVVKTPLKSALSYRTYLYEPSRPRTTDMIIGRGIVRDPSQLQLIPDDAASSPVFVFTDERVASVYGYEFTAKLRLMGYDVHLIVLPEGESAKSLTSYAFWVERVLSQGVDERSRFISLGGGVVCNVCGFVASTIYRGLDLVHLPTTLMSQCDAAISHKQGINGHQGKNLVGAYYTPRLVAVDVEALSTLPDRLLYDGMSEVIKHAIGQDPNYVDFLLSHDGSIRDLDFLEKVIENNIRLKCALVSTDPKEHREGMILQYGHTVGHAVEHLTGYRLYHGESVAVGMMVAAYVARIMGACSEWVTAVHERLLEKYRLPTRVPDAIRADHVLEALRYDKRYLTEGTRMALLEDIGQLWTVDGDYAIPVSSDVLIEAITRLQEKPSKRRRANAYVNVNRCTSSRMSVG